MDTMNTKSCLMHTGCSKCGESVDDEAYNNKCGKCSRIYCPNHIKDNMRKPQCINCWIRKEYKVKRSAIQVALNKHMDFFHDYIIKMITEFSMGFSTNCCNSKCKQEIAVDSNWTFKLSKDCHDKAIGFYQPKYNQQNRECVKINGKGYRIFCAECIQSPDYKQCNDWDCSNYEYEEETISSRLCGNHR